MGKRAATSLSLTLNIYCLLIHHQSREVKKHKNKLLENSKIIN